MPLDTQSFDITRYWLSTAIKHIPGSPDVLTSKAQLNKARKLFLAGNNQLPSIKNWLTAAAVIEKDRKSVKLTDIGQLMAAQDSRAESALTWWLLHLHLCVNSEAFPYPDFFFLYDSEGRWLSKDDIVDCLAKHAQDKQLELKKDSVDTYFSGVARAFRIGGFVHELGLVEERIQGDGRRVRRRLVRPDDTLVAYGAVLFQKQFYPGQATVEAREILGKGLSRVLGIRDSDVRDSLSRITTNKDLSQHVQYRQQVNLDSIQFLQQAEAALREIRTKAYRSQAVKWQ